MIATEREQMVSVLGAAKLLRTTPRTVKNRLDAGSFPDAIRSGSRLKWPKKHLELWVQLGHPDAATFRKVVERIQERQFEQVVSSVAFG